MRDLLPCTMVPEYDKLAASVGVRLMVGQLTLDQYVGVRILYPQLANVAVSAPPQAI